MIKQHRIVLSWVCLCAAALVLLVCQPAYADLSVILTTEKTTYEIGETVTFYYEIVGVEGELTISYTLTAYGGKKDASMRQSYNLEGPERIAAQGELSTSSGSIEHKITQNDGIGLRLRVNYSEKRGTTTYRSYEYKNIYISNGQVVEDYPVITITPRVSSARFQEEIIADYVINGGTPEYSSVECRFCMKFDNQSDYEMELEPIHSRQGIISAAITNGDATGGYFKIKVQDQTGWISEATTSSPVKLITVSLGQKGWVFQNGKYYYGDEDGSCHLGDLWIDQKHYFFGPDGAMVIGWCKDRNQQWQYAAENGEILNNLYGQTSIVIPSDVNQLNIRFFSGIGKDFVIYCEPSSYAERFAKKNCLQFDNGRSSIRGSEIQSADEKVNWVIQTYMDSSMSKLEKAKVAHDWLRNNAYYDQTLSIHNAEGVLLRGTGVCESYAKAYKMFLDKIGIENHRMVGGNHTWNLVKLGDEWYHIDVTWDDPVGSRYDDCVLSGLENNRYFMINDTLRGLTESDCPSTSNIRYEGTPGWQAVDQTWVYYDESGILVTRPRTIDGKRYMFKENGAVFSNGWNRANGKWYYVDGNGALVTDNWMLDGYWYYFDAEGVMSVGWQPIQNEWYYFDASGRMITGWLNDGGSWYYLNADGTMAVGWLNDGRTRYYMRSSGQMASGWIKADGNWYYLNASGQMLSGWLNDGGKWYYLASSGEMLTGWQDIDGGRYYFDVSGQMKTGWLEIQSGQWYWLDQSGCMATGSRNIGGTYYQFDENGLWIE